MAKFCFDRKVISFSSFPDEPDLSLEEREKQLEERLEARRLQEEEDRRERMLLGSDEDESPFEKPEEDEPPAKTPTAYYSSDDDDEEEIVISPEERKLLEAENERLFADLNTVKDSVSQIETKVVKIAELQSVFTEKVLGQKEEIELVNR